MMRFTLKALIAGFSLLGFSALPVFPCSYLANPNPPVEYIISRTETVFFGTLIQKNLRTVKEEGNTYRVHSLLFRVDEYFKGNKAAKQSIEFWEKIKNRDSCDVSAPESKVGQQWVVFVGYDEETDVQQYIRHDQYLSWHFEPDNKYDRPRLEATRSAALRPRSSFFGEIEIAMLGAPKEGLISHIELRSEDASELLKTTTQPYDKFQFNDVPRGTYTIRIHASPQVEKFLYPIEKPTSASQDGKARLADFQIKMDGIRPQFENFVIHWN